MTGALWNEHPGTYLQSHVSENHDEVAWVKELYPERKGYLDVYDHYRQLGPRVDLRARHLADGGRAAALPRNRHGDRALPDVERVPRQRPVQLRMP